MELNKVPDAVAPLSTIEDLIDWIKIHSYLWTKLECIKVYTRKDMIYMKVQDTRSDRRFLLGTINDVSWNIQKGFYEDEIETYALSRRA